MVFIAATAICDQLKLEGLSTLQVYLNMAALWLAGKPFSSSGISGD